MANEELNTANNKKVFARQEHQVPLYMESAEYARKHGELEDFRSSFKANVACKEAIEAAIRDHYRDNRLRTDDAILQVVKEFGVERTLCVLAVTVRDKDWDGRISNDNKLWAKDRPIPKDDSDRSCYYVVDQSHPGLTDLFLTRLRKDHPELEKKPSVLRKLESAKRETAAKEVSQVKKREAVL